MPPHLHPRSTATSTLFAGTLLASFTVVAIPHIFPCPRPRRAYADAERRQPDTEGHPVRPKRRKRSQERPEDYREETAEPSNLPYPTQPQTQTEAQTLTPAAAAPALASPEKDPRISDEAALFRQFQAEAKMLDKEAHECPVPKPGGMLGRLLGFSQRQESMDENERDTVRRER